MRIEISQPISKSGRAEDCEDAAFHNEFFACVVDGATSVTPWAEAGRTGGQLAAQAICEAIAALPRDIDAQGAIRLLSQEVARRCSKLSEPPSQTPTASVAIYSESRREMWLVGDCQALVIGSDGTNTWITNRRRVDEVTSQARSLYLAAERAAGKSIEELRRDDPGREFIEELLVRQRQFQNAHIESEHCYWVIDGSPIDPTGIKIVPVAPESSAVVLASDGYPRLFSTVKETEDFLAEVIRNDPLMYQGEFKSTKGVRPGHQSYDDRTFLKILLE